MNIHGMWVMTVVAVGFTSPLALAKAHTDTIQSVIPVADKLPVGSRLQVADRAYRRADGAPEGSAQRWVYPAGPLAELSRINGIDRVSLKVRAVRQLAKTDAVAAVDLFNEIELPVGSPASCPTPSIANFALYYDVMQEIAKRLSAPLARRSLIEAHMSRFRTIPQIAPFAGVLVRIPGAALDGGPELARQLPSLERDTAAFSACFSSAIDELRALGLELSPADRGPLVSNARRWLIQNVTAGICAPRRQVILASVGSPGTVSPIPWSRPIDLFNLELGVLGDGTGGLINTHALTPPPDGPQAPQFAHSAGWVHLSFMGTLLEGDEPKDSARWKREASEYVSQLVEWSDGGDIEGFYLEKSQLLRTAIRTMQEVSESAGNETVGRGRVASRGCTSALCERLIYALQQLIDGPIGRTVYARRHFVWYASLADTLADYRSDQVLSLARALVRSSNPIVKAYADLAVASAQAN